MSPEALTSISESLQTMRGELGKINALISAQRMAVSDRNYLHRCIDLLQIELSAIGDYVAGLT